VKESAVIGVPHSDFGEAVVTVLVAEPGSVPDLEAIKEAVKAKLANYKRPKEYIVLGALPRNTMGKVQKKTLRTEYADIFQTLDRSMSRAGE
jgi:malonyl-CoA/methylmalonyl-CoA synthetase